MQQKTGHCSKKQTLRSILTTAPQELVNFNKLWVLYILG